MTAQENAGNALMLLLGEVVAKAVRAEMDAQRAALVAELQEWASPPQAQELEQLLGLDEIARRLDCSKQTVSARMMSVTWYIFPKRMSVEAALVAYMEAMRVKGGSYTRWSTGRARAVKEIIATFGEICCPADVAAWLMQHYGGAVCQKDFRQ